MRVFLKFSILALLVFLMGCKESKQPISVVLDGQPETVAKIREWLESNPQIPESVFGEKYVVKIIPPDSSIDYKITIIRPDPAIDFKIGIIDPSGNKQTKQMRELEEKLVELIRKQLQENEKSKK